MVLSLVASSGRPDTTLMIIDVRRAFFYAPATRRIFVELPEEDWQPGDEAMCGLLHQSLYGTRDAAQNWEIELGNFMEGLGFTRGRASRCLYHHKETGMAAAVHGTRCHDCWD